MSRESGKDLTSGSPFGLILGFALPMLLGLLFQQFYNMVDTMVVGQCLGVTSLAAVGSTGSINFMINGFCIGAATGFAIPVAQKFGAGDHKGMRKFVANASVCGCDDGGCGRPLHGHPPLDEHAGGHYPGGL